MSARGIGPSEDHGRLHPRRIVPRATNVLLVALACFAGTALVADNLPPLFVSPLWPTNAILLCALLAAPVRHWWAYLLVGFASSVYHNAQLGDPLRQILLFLAADVLEVFAAALGVRRFAGGLAAFERPRHLVAYFIAICLATFASSFVAAFAAPAGAYWTLWHSWFLADTCSFLTLTAAIFSWLALWQPAAWTVTRARVVEVGLLAAGLLVTVVLAFRWWPGIALDAPARMYLPLPFLLWAAVRFGSPGANTSLALVTILAMSGVLAGTGPFAASSPAANALSLQVFLLTIAPPLVFLGVLVEEQMRAERALRRSEAQYRGVVDDQTELICRFLPDGTFTFVNGAICRGLRRSAEDIIGTRVWDLVPAASQPVIREYLNGLTPDRPVASREQADALPATFGHWHHWTTRAFFDERGAVTEFQAVGRDITDRKHAEEERRQRESQRQMDVVLRASEERFRSLADNAPVLILMSAASRDAVYFNRPWLDFTGRSLEDQRGSGWMDSIHPDDRQAYLETRDRAFARREPLSVQFRLRRHDGEYRWMLNNGTPYVGADGAASGYVESCADITMHKLAAEELEQAARRKDEFLAMLGHELRNPLAPISSAVEIMRLAAPADESITWARDVIARQLGQLTRLVEDLLDVSRITRGKITLHRTTLELRSVVAQAVETSRPLIDARGHTLAVHVPSEPVWVHGDTVRLGQVVSNMLNNAAKYTPDGGRIAVTLYVRASQATVTVADNGVGLSPEMVGRVFDLFSQFESPDRAQGGLGIGLTLVKRLVEMHGGHVEARSAGRSHGSEFIVRLPVCDARPEARGVATHADPAAATRRRVLVVDDNVDAAEALSRILQLDHHEVCVAHDGEAALEMAGAMQPEIVFLDLGMPKMSGLEVARRLRTECAVGPRVLIATTGFGQAEDRRRTAEAGFDHHLVKPIDPRMLRSLLASTA